MVNRFKTLFAVAISCLLLAGCDNTELISEVNKTADFVGGRLGTGTSPKTAQDGTESITLLREGIWYTWQNDSNKSLYEAPNGTRLLEATVENVVDGDTVDLLITNGKDERVRLILVDTPESKGKYEKNPQAYSLEASAFTEDLLLGRKVWIEKGIEERDKYGRLLAYIWLDQVVMNREVAKDDGEVVIIGEKIGLITVNELLLREGLARVAIFPPNTEYVDEFERVQKNAKLNQKGMWNK